jgi:arginyl-tRNA synthetase
LLRDELKLQIESAIARLVQSGTLPETVLDLPVEVADTKTPEHGDFTCNFALASSKRAGMNPRAVGEALRASLLDAHLPLIESIDIAGPGFLNLRLAASEVSALLPRILALGPDLAKSATANPPRRVNVEFVSVNPNGPITIGSGRGAAFGDTLSRVLEAARNVVDREYYINDGVNSEQMRLFAESVRSYVTGQPFPDKGYKGDYVKDVASGVLSEIDALYSVANFAALVILDQHEELTGDQDQDLQNAAELVRSFRHAVVVAMGLLSHPSEKPEPSELLDRIVDALSEEGDLSDSADLGNQALAEAIASTLTAVALSGEEAPPTQEDAIAVVRHLAEGGAPSRTIERWVGSLLEKRKRLDIYASARAYGDSLLMAFAKEDLADQPVSWFQARAQAKMIERQRSDLATFGVKFDRWFSEQSLHDEGKVATALVKLEEAGNAYFADASRAQSDAAPDAQDDEAPTSGQMALWLASTKFGDDKDRVLVRGDGRPAYIAADVAYLEDKLGTRGYDKSFLILGPDHHGYIGRMMAVCEALGFSRDRFEIIIFQLVRFLKDGKPAPMRKRDGNIYELRDLIEEIGTRTAPSEPREEQLRIGADVARFFYLMRSQDTAMDFDIDLATKQSDDNPVFYAQYAHARICSVIDRAAETFAPTDFHPELLTHDREKALIKKILDLPWEVQRCATDYGVHRLATYVVELGRTFHHFYDVCRVVQPEQPELSTARVALCEATRGALRATFALLGVSAPTRMERRIEAPEETKE